MKTLRVVCFQFLFVKKTIIIDFLVMLYIVITIAPELVLFNVKISGAPLIELSIV